MLAGHRCDRGQLPGVVERDVEPAVGVDGGGSNHPADVVLDCYVGAENVPCAPALHPTALGNVRCSLSPEVSVIIRVTNAPGEGDPGLHA